MNYFIYTSQNVSLFGWNCRGESFSFPISGEDPVSIELNPPPFLDGSRFQLPIAVMASNRPSYLLRMLLGLQKVEGLDPSMITVFIDGFWSEPASVTKLIGVKLEQHAGVSRLNARIGQVHTHYLVYIRTSSKNYTQNSSSNTFWINAREKWIFELGDRPTKRPCNPGLARGFLYSTSNLVPRAFVTLV